MFGELTTKYENERAELRADFEKQINYDISTSNIVKNTKKAKSIQEKGLGELKTEEGKKLNEELNRIKEVYTKEKYSGELAQLTNEYAKKLSEVKNDRAGREQIKREFNERVRETIRNRYREEEQNVAGHKGVPDSSTSLFGEPEKTTAAAETTKLRKVEEIPLEKDKAENFNVGDRFFDKKGDFWIVRKKFKDGSFMAEGYPDPNTGKIRNTIFKGDIKIRGKNAPETGFSGETPYSGATENALRTLAELELNKKKIYKDNPNYNIELDKELKKAYIKYNLANYERLPLIKRIARKLQEFRNYATQRYDLDYNDPKQAYASYIFRNMEAGLSYSIHKTKEAIYHTLKPLMEVKDGVEKFSMYRVLRTLKHDIDSGLYSYKKKDPAQIEALEGKYKQLPFGWTKEYVIENFNKLDKEFKENPYLKAANDIWDNYWEEVTAEGVKKFELFLAGSRIARVCVDFENLRQHYENIFELFLAGSRSKPIQIL